MKTKKIAAMATAAALLTSVILSGCSNAPANTVFSKQDLPNKTIGVQLGTTGDTYATQEYEEKGSTIERYNKGADAVMALKQGKIDCVIIDSEPAKVFVEKNDGLKILDEPFVQEDYAVAVAKGSELKDKINGALAELKQDGTLESIISNYIGDDAGNSPYESPEGVDRSNGTLVMATNAEFPPYESKDGDKIIGIDADMAQAVCDKLGYELKIEDMAFDSIITAVQTGKADMAVAGLTVTEERQESVDFTDSYTTATQAIIVRDK